MLNYYAYIMIVPRGKASKMSQTAFRQGINNSTIVAGRGVIKDGLLNLLGFYDNQKEIIIMLADENIGRHATDKITKKYRLDKPHNGIMFNVKLKEAYGVEGIDLPKVEEENENMKVIFTVVDRGLSSQVVECANKAGATGGTILNGRGSGIENAPKLFNIEIEPEKEIILTIVSSIQKDKVVNAIKEEMRTDEPNKGIIFVVDLAETYGLYNPNK
ncbi:MAG TPA: P-II family nitrogen regulator [Acholeplasmataceae bacterium]|nr:P-II family nitrogen regulator [Acholeplasmataceae bacterium]